MMENQVSFQEQMPISIHSRYPLTCIPAEVRKKARLFLAKQPLIVLDP